LKRSHSLICSRAVAAVPTAVTVNVIAVATGQVDSETMIAEANFWVCSTIARRAVWDGTGKAGGGTNLALRRLNP